MTSAQKLHPVAAVIVFGLSLLLVAALLVVSTVANVAVWWNSAEGWHRYVFSVIGIASEGWGALGLVLLTLRAAQGQWLKAAVCFALWLPAVGFNGYSSYRYFMIEAAASEVGTLESQTKAGQADARIEELTKRIDALGVTRAADAVKAELDLTPENRVTKRSQLAAELANAETAAKLEAEREGWRTAKLETIGATVKPAEASMSVEWVLAALVLWMEAMKAVALWVLFGRTKGAAVAAPEVAQPKADALGEAAPEIVESHGTRIIEGPDGARRVVRLL
jgi:hypothetical protein